MTDSQPYRKLDVVDQLWIDLLATAGITVRRDASCFVSYDGAGTLLLAPKADLDPDDTVAALLLHELCHCAVRGDAMRGDAGREQPDWGLTYAAEPDLSDEHAVLRLQRWLATQVGLAAVLHPTTEHRVYYDALALCAFAEELTDPRFAAQEDKVIEIATRARKWLTAQRWWPALDQTLQKTAAAAG